MSIVPPVLSEWVPGPFVLNTNKCGRRAKFSGDNSVVERERPEEYYNGCVAYTANPLPLSQVWQTTILRTTMKYGGLEVGVTTTLPDKVPDYLPGIVAGNHEWTYCGNSLYHNRSSTDYSHFRSLDDCQVGTTVGLLVTARGELHLFLDGEHAAKLTTGLPVHKSLFGAVDVRCRCFKIKSEILSGGLATNGDKNDAQNDLSERKTATETLISGSVASTTSSLTADPGTKTLGIKDLFDIVTELNDVAVHWRGIGLALRLRDPCLNTISMERNSVHGCLTDMLREWLNQNYDCDKYGKPSWKMLAEAVRHRAGGNNAALADQICKKYSV